MTDITDPDVGAREKNYKCLVLQETSIVVQNAAPRQTPWQGAGALERRALTVLK
jgi:hypothetical protein